jgi:hypothetical protein
MLLPAWRRHLSNLLVILGFVAFALLALMSVATVIQLVVLNRAMGVLEPHYVMTLRKQMDVVWVTCIVLSATAPGLFLSGLALRRIIAWKSAWIAVLALAVALNAYFFWWRSEALRLIVEHERGSVGQAVSPFR